MCKSFIDQSKAARLVATSLIGVTTPDPSACLLSSFPENASPFDTVGR